MSFKDRFMKRRQKKSKKSSTSTKKANNLELEDIGFGDLKSLVEEASLDHLMKKTESKIDIGHTEKKTSSLVSILSNK